MTTTSTESESPKCGECGAEMTLRRPKLKFQGKPFWGCSRFPACRGTHGAHPDGRPLGVPGSREDKNARILAHAWFDCLWQRGAMTRVEAYAWLHKTLPHLPKHIGEMNAAQCAEVAEAAKAKGFELLAEKHRAR